MDELLEASKLFRAHLDRYITACSLATASYDPTNEGDHNSPLLDAITNELETLAGYEQDIQNAKSILARSRNSSVTLVPINALPSEVLVWIFELADHSWRHTEDLERINTDYDERSSDVPEEYVQFKMDIDLSPLEFAASLSQVCTRWRHIALGSHKLWSRIDLPILDESYESLLLRGENFASRVAPPKLDLHILMANEQMVSASLYRDLNNFCASVGSNIQSLQLTSGVKARWRREPLLINLLNSSFGHLVAGTLDHLALIDHYSHDPRMIRSSDMREDQYYYDFKIGVSQRQIDEILGPVRSLWLKNCYFPWESPAYLGLVDLRLFASGRHKSISIEPPQLTNILSSCPKLRIFHCDIEVKKMGAGIQSTAKPIHLAELEELNLCRMNPAQHQDFLPLLSPGRKPLSLSIQVTVLSSQQSLFSTVVLDFFNRSNVEALYIRGHEFPTLPLLRLLTSTPISVRIVGLEELDLDVTNVPLSPKQTHLARLDCLNLKECFLGIELGNFREMLDVCQVRTVKLLYDSQLPETLRGLAAIFPVIKYIDSTAPIEEWNSWGIWEWNY